MKLSLGASGDRHPAFPNAALTATLMVEPTDRPAVAVLGTAVRIQATESGAPTLVVAFSRNVTTAALLRQVADMIDPPQEPEQTQAQVGLPGVAELLIGDVRTLRSPITCFLCGDGIPANTTVRLASVDEVGPRYAHLRGKCPKAP